MSFGPANTTKTAENNVGGTSNTLLNTQYPQIQQAGTNLFNEGQQTTAPGVNFLNTILQGNQANTAAALAPSIQGIQSTNAAAKTAINTLMPRGGGRYSTNYGLSFAPQAQIQNLFNTARTGAATALPQIGLQESNLGSNLFGLGTNTLNAAGGLNLGLADVGQRQQQMNNSIAASLGSGLFNLASNFFRK